MKKMLEYCVKTKIRVALICLAIPFVSVLLKIPIFYFLWPQLRLYEINFNISLSGFFVASLASLSTIAVVGEHIKHKKKIEKEKRPLFSNNA